MKFENSGLIKDKLVQSAFEYNQKHMDFRVRELLVSVKEQIEEQIQAHLSGLEDKKKKGEISEEVYNLNRAHLDKVREREFKTAPLMIRQQLEKTFAERTVVAALELQNSSVSPSPAAVAAALVFDCVRSPRDYVAVSKDVGIDVANIVSDLLHFNMYDSEKETGLPVAKAEVKCLHLVLTLTALQHMTRQVEKLVKAGGKGQIHLPEGQEAEIFANFKLVSGTDAKLDERFMNAFNTAMGLIQSPFTIEAGASGQYDLVKSSVKPSSKTPTKTPPKGKKKNDKDGKPPEPPKDGSNGGGFDHNVF